MRSVLGLTTLTLLLVCACSTVSKRQTQLYAPAPILKPVDLNSKDPVAVDHWLETQYRETGTETVLFLTRYLQARLWSPLEPSKACALWLEVANASRFALAHVARLRALETCPLDRPGLPSIDDVVDSTPEPWLKEALFRVALNRAIRGGDKRQELRFSREVVAFERSQRAKVTLLQRALALANELGEKKSATDIQAQLEQVAPRFISQPTPEQLMSVASDLRQNRQFERAREMYRSVFTSPTSTDLERLRALDGIRMTYKLQKNTSQFLTSTQEYSLFAKQKFFKNQTDSGLISKYLEAQVTYARAMWTEDLPKEAKRLLTQTEKELRGLVPLDESIWVRARIEEEAGRFAAAAKILERVDLNRVTDRSLRNKILWYRAWNMKKARRHKEASLLFARLVREEDNVNLVPRDRFWLGKTLITLGDRESAQKEFDWLLQNDPLGYYGLLAYRELKQPLPPLGSLESRSAATVRDFQVPENTPPQSVSGALSPEDRVMVEWLIATKENDLAKRFLDSATQGSRSSFNEAQTLDLLQLYAQSGNYQTLYVRLSDLAPSRRSRILEAVPDLLFPSPWPSFVAKAAKKFAVEPELIYAIMRQESSFNPLARSPADAFGLMQLIPEAAKKMESASGISIGDHDDLYDPENNIYLGSAFIRSLLDRWKDQFILSVASYNASEKAITGWMKTRYRGQQLEFIEDIPYEETRNYVKLVLRNYVFYKRLESRGREIAFPEECLANLHRFKP